MKIWEKMGPGQPQKFKTPEEMWEKAVAYFNDCTEANLLESKAFAFQGESWLEEVPKMRAMTQQGLCAYLGCTIATYHNYKAKPEFFEITSQIDAVMFEQKFSGAAAGLLNANLIARDLGIADKQEISHGGDTTPWSSIKSTDE